MIVIPPNECCCWDVIDKAPVLGMIVLIGDEGIKTPPLRPNSGNSRPNRHSSFPTGSLSLISSAGLYEVGEEKWGRKISLALIKKSKFLDRNNWLIY
jgi:hypothetical protein